MKSMGSAAPVIVQNVDSRYSSMTRQALYNFNIEARSRNHCCSVKAISITYSDCEFVALSIQHTVCMRHTVSCGLPGSTIFFCTLFHNRQDCRNNSFDFSQLLFATFIILRKTEQDMTKNAYWFSCKVPVFFLSDFNET
jgi:hypothetical protein